MIRNALATALLLLLPVIAITYPMDGYEWTGIKRLEAARLTQEGQLAGKPQPQGGTLKLEQVDIRLRDRVDFQIPAPDPEFTVQVRALLGGRAGQYSIAVLDLSDLNNPKYAEHEAHVARNPGSVGKLVVALAVFQMLSDLYPQDMEKRRQILKDTRIIADEFVISDSHTVRFFDLNTRILRRHPLHPGDEGTLWEFMDWMVSASSNSAASAVMKELTLMAHFRERYPVSREEGDRFIDTTPKSQLSDIFTRALQEPVTRNGLDLAKLRQGGLFTEVGQSKIPGPNSYATPHELMRYVVKMEQGKLVDEWSSREIKRLLYSTERRIRYASSPALFSAAVYFKSGSLFRCYSRPCPAYRGDKENLMNSVAIVETPAETRERYYIVTLMTNILRVNSASEHAALAARIDQLIAKRHPVAP
ncbi:MAG: serine hydrolase [Chromatiales bacterium]